MYAFMRLVLLGAGGIAIVYAMINLFGNFWPTSVLSLVVAGVLFYVSQFIQPPEVEEVEPDEIDMETDFAKQMAESRRQRRANMDESATADAESKDKDK